MIAILPSVLMTKPEPFLSTTPDVGPEGSAL